MLGWPWRPRLRTTGRSTRTSYRRPSAACWPPVNSNVRRQMRSLQAYIRLFSAALLAGCATTGGYETVFISGFGGGTCELSTTEGRPDTWKVPGEAMRTQPRGITVHSCNVTVPKRLFEERYERCALTGFSFGAPAGAAGIAQPSTKCTFRQANDGNYYFSARGAGSSDSCYWECRKVGR
jgi:hypothetical protein